MGDEKNGGDGTLGAVLKAKIPDVEKKLNGIVAVVEKANGLKKEVELPEKLDIDVDGIADLFFGKEVIARYCEKVKRVKALEIIEREAEIFADALANQKSFSETQYAQEILALLAEQKTIPKVLRSIVMANKDNVQIPTSLVGINGNAKADDDKGSGKTIVDNNKGKTAKDMGVDDLIPESKDATSADSEKNKKKTIEKKGDWPTYKEFSEKFGKFGDRRPEFYNKDGEVILIEYYDEEKGKVRVSIVQNSKLEKDKDGIINFSVGKTDYGKTETKHFNYKEFEDFIKDCVNFGFVTRGGEEVRYKKIAKKEPVKKTKKVGPKEKVITNSDNVGKLDVGKVDQEDFKNLTLEEFEERYEYGKRYFRETSKERIIVKLIKYFPSTGIVVLEEEGKNKVDRREECKNFIKLYKLASEDIKSKKTLKNKKMENLKPTPVAKKDAVDPGAVIAENLVSEEVLDGEEGDNELIGESLDIDTVEALKAEKDVNDNSENSDDNVTGEVLDPGTIDILKNGEKTELEPEKEGSINLDDLEFDDEAGEKIEKDNTVETADIQGFKMNIDDSVETSAQVARPEKGGNPETEGRVPEVKWSIEMLSVQNKSIWERMSERGKKFFSDIYDSAKSKLPDPASFLGKIGIAYNQLWMNKHEEKAAKLKGKMDKIEMQRGALKKAKDEISRVVENLKKQGIPGSESLQVKMRVLEQKDAKFLNKKDKIQSKFEDRDNRLALYKNDRDRIAKSFISKYDQKLSPVESELRGLKKELAEVCVAGEERLNGCTEQIAGWESQRESIRAAYKLAGDSDRQIRKDSAVKMLDQLIKSSQKNTAKLEKMLSQKKASINEEIARLDKNANPYRDRRETFVRTTGLKPVRAEVSGRERGAVSSQEEEVRSSSREKEEAVVADSDERVDESEKKDEEEKTENPIDGSNVENSAEEEKKVEVGLFINYFNRKIIEKFGSKSKFYIDRNEFTRESNVKIDERVEKEDFNKMLINYYKKKKIDIREFKLKENK